jgi:membrane associated rhomboid family serine protease
VGIYDRDYFREQQPSGLSSYLPRSAVGAIIAVNAAVWLVDAFTATSNHTGSVYGPVTTHWLSNLFAAHVSTLTEPWYWWQFLTAGFTHAPLGSKDGIWHIVGNMAVLYFLGRPVEDRYGPKEFLRFYLVALVFANVVWCVVGKLTISPEVLESVDPGLYGASGAIAAVVVLFAFNFPDVTILLFFVIPMPAWLFGVLIVGYDIYGAMGGNRGSNVAYTAHVAGAAFGLLYYQRGWKFSRLGMGGLRWPRSPFRAKPRLRVHRPDDESPPDDLSAEVDRILEKIYREGEASLTPKERSTLEAASRKYQERRGNGK